MAAMPENQTKFARRKELIVRELLAALLLTVLLLGLALLLPIGYSPPKPENAGVGEITAPWLIIWLQVLLRYLPPFLAGLILPLAALLLFSAFPWLPGAGRPHGAPRYHFGLHLAILLALGGALTLLTFWGL
jgi:hypothetical protein